MMGVKFRIGDREVEFEPGGFQVIASAPGRHLVDFGDGPATLFTATGAEGTWVWYRGRARLVRPADDEPRRAGRKSGGPAFGGVTPLTPGVVVRVLVKVGDPVRKGQPLVVVSAMKMESTLVAAHGGTVTAIRAEAGANVRPGDVLVEVEPERSS